MASTWENEDDIGHESGTTVEGPSSLHVSTAELIMVTSTHRKFHIYTPEHLFPKSSYVGSDPLLPPTSEADVLSEIRVCKFFNAVSFTDVR